MILWEARHAFWQIDMPLEICIPGYDAKCYLFVFYVKTVFVSEALWRRMVNDELNNAWK